MIISLWAPHASHVDAVVDGRKHRLMATDDDHWSIDLEPGTRYQLQLDGADLLLPDPRSMCQPEGAHGQASLLILRILLLPRSSGTAQTYVELYSMSSILVRLPPRVRSAQQSISSMNW